jgi:hypothetical protein
MNGVLREVRRGVGWNSWSVYYSVSDNDEREDIELCWAVADILRSQGLTWYRVSLRGAQVSLGFGS